MFNDQQKKPVNLQAFNVKVAVSHQKDANMQVWVVTDCYESNRNSSLIAKLP